MSNELWRVVITDNYNRESHADHLYSEGHTEEEANRIADEKNAEEPEHTPNWFVAVDDSYKLWQGMAELF